MKYKLNIPHIIIFLLFFSCSCKEEKKTDPESFTVSGKIKGLSSDFMTRSYKDENGHRVSDSVFVENENFTYTSKLKEPTFIVFWPNVESTIKRASSGGYYPAKSSQFAFLASPGDEIVFKGEITDFVNAYPSGTKANKDLASINKRIFPLLNKSVNLLLEKGKLPEDDPVHTVLADSIEALNQEVNHLKKKFITSNPGSEAAAWYLSDMMMRHQISDEEAITAFNALDNKLEYYPFYKEVAARVKGIETTMTGNTIPDFTTLTIDGNEFQFSSLKGKYVLVDFWGIWCGPCVAEMPKVKEYHDKYNENLAILGINSGDTKEKIENFVSSNDYDWTQIMAGEGNENLVLKFNVSGFPTKFIIDPEGKILHRFVGSGEAAFGILDELLN